MDNRGEWGKLFIGNAREEESAKLEFIRREYGLLSVPMNISMNQIHGGYLS